MTTPADLKALLNVNPIIVGGDFAFSTAAGTANNNLSLPGTVNLGGAARTVTANGGGVLYFGGVVSNGSLIKAGTGEVDLRNSGNTFSNLDVKQGTLSFGNGGNVLGTGTLTLGNSSGGSDAATLLNIQSNYVSETYSKPITLASGVTGTLNRSGRRYQRHA